MIIISLKYINSDLSRQFKKVVVDWRVKRCGVYITVEKNERIIIYQKGEGQTKVDVNIHDEFDYCCSSLWQQMLLKGHLYCKAGSNGWIYH